MQLMAREQDRQTLLLGQAGQQAPHLGDALGIEPVGGLVEDQVGGAPQERLGDAEALAHALAVGAHRAIAGVAEADRLEVFGRFGARARRAQALGDAERIQIFTPVPARIKSAVLDQRPDAGAALFRVLAGVEAVDPHRAGSARQKAEQGAHRGRLAGAVVAQEPGDGPIGHIEGDAFQDRGSAEADAQTSQLHGHSGEPSPPGPRLEARRGNPLDSPEPARGSQAMIAALARGCRRDPLSGLERCDFARPSGGRFRRGLAQPGTVRAPGTPARGSSRSRHPGGSRALEGAPEPEPARGPCVGPQRPASFGSRAPGRRPGPPQGEAGRRARKPSEQTGARPTRAAGSKAAAARGPPRRSSGGLPASPRGSSQTPRNRVRAPGGAGPRSGPRTGPARRRTLHQRFMML